MIKVPKINLGKISNFQQIKSSEQLTNYQTSRISHDALSYTFRIRSENIKKEHKDSNLYINDLSKTLTLNLEIINSILKSTDFNENKKTQLERKLLNIISSFQNFNQLKDKKFLMRNKILISSQILEEAKRNKEENAEYFDDQQKSLIEGIKKKSIFMKRFQKKFNEVEIYIQRECQKFQKWKKIFAEFEVESFLIDNENYLQMKSELYSSIKKLDTDVKMILKENLELKKREESIWTEEGTSIIGNAPSKADNLMRMYTLKINYLKRNKECLLKALTKFDKMIHNKNVHDGVYKKINPHFFDDEEVVENEKEGNNNNISNININLSRINEGGLDTNISKIEKKKMEWDISCIRQTEEQ